MSPPRAALSTEQVLAFHTTLSNWGRFGPRDQLGTLNLITPEKRAAAARLVRSGRTVSAARPLPTEPSVENPNPVAHHMIGDGDRGLGRRLLRDRLARVRHLAHRRPLSHLSPGQALQRVPDRDGDRARRARARHPRAARRHRLARRAARHSAHARRAVPRAGRADLPRRPRARGARRGPARSSPATCCSCAPAAGRCARRAVRGTSASRPPASTPHACRGCTRAVSPRSAATASPTSCRRASRGCRCPSTASRSWRSACT